MSDYSRLPIYILADRSGSMFGARIALMNEGIRNLVQAVREHSRANEIASVSLLSFGSDCRQDVPLTEVELFTAPELKAGGRTAFGAALRMTAECIRREVRQTDRHKEIIGDWAPLLFILTDGEPTDDWRSGLQELRSLDRR